MSTTYMPLILVSGFFYILHSILASTQAKGLLTPYVGAQYYRLLYNAISFVGLGAIVWLFNLSPNNLLLPYSTLLNIIGGLSLLGGLVVGFFASRQYSLGEFSGVEYVVKKERPVDTLNTTGINGIVRHPLYLSLILLLVSWFCFKPEMRIALFTGITILYVPLGIYFEEKKLIDQFGEAYLSYRKKVAMLIPFVW